MKWTIALCATALIGAAGYFGHAALKNAYVQQGYDAAVRDYQYADGELLRKAQAAWAAQTDRLNELQGEHNAAKADLDAVRSRLASAADKLRKATADFEARVSSATAEGLRRYAALAEANYGRCRAHVERLGLEAASCARAAHTLNGELDLRNVPASDPPQ